MSSNYTVSNRLDTLRSGLLDIGYQNNLLLSEYSFADVLGDEPQARRIELAAFAQEPSSYRSACFGVTVPQSSNSEAILPFRALGAPQILALQPEEGRIDHWKILAQGKPEHIGSYAADYIRTVIQEHQDEWRPDQVLRAKSIGFSRDPRQLDFVDIGLLPAIDGIVQKKLDILLNQVLAAVKHLYQEHSQSALDYKALFRLVFRLIAAKLLSDRQRPGGWNSSDAQTAIKAVKDFYFQGAHSEPVLPNEQAQDLAWNILRKAFSFSNLSVEALAYVYENTLVRPETRKVQDIHATPPEIAEYVVRHLPFEDLDMSACRVFEPFAGHGPFLIAALGRLRSLLPTQFTPQERHERLVRMLSGMEIDSFAVEVARYSLMLADYPNSNGWRIDTADVFNSPEADKQLEQAQVILCNPPFGDFTPEERQVNTSIHSTNKAVEALRRVLLHPPKMLGFVLPNVIRNGQSYREIRKQLATHYQHINLVALPAGPFRHSTVETTVLTAYGTREGQSVWRSSGVDKQDYAQFIQTGEVSWQIERRINYVPSQSKLVVLPGRLQQVWDALSHLSLLADVANVHQGIQYNISVKDNAPALVSNVLQDGFAPGLVTARGGFEPYNVSSFSYLNINSRLMRRKAYKLPWDKPKVIVNAARISADRWMIAGAVDKQGLICSQRFHGIWPKSDVPVEVIAAVINSPVANAFVSTQRTSRDNQVRTIETVPMPTFRLEQVDTITSLVREYRAYREQWLEQPLQAAHFERLCRQLVYQIDAEVLAAYDLSPRLEKELLDYFAGYKRPGPVQFDRYYPPGFRPAIPWREFISEDFRASSARQTLERLPVIYDPAITAMIEALDD